MSEIDNDVLTALRNVPGFEAVASTDCISTRQGGLTNRVFLVEARGERVIVRIPGEGTEDYIDRKVELVNARAAARAGISADVLWADAASGIMITRAIDGIETMTPDLFQSRHGSPARAGRALAKLHNSGEVFDFRFELFAMIDDYLNVLSTKEVDMKDG